MAEPWEIYDTDPCGKSYPCRDGHYEPSFKEKREAIINVICNEILKDVGNTKEMKDEKKKIVERVVDDLDLWLEVEDCLEKWGYLRDYFGDKTQGED